MGKFGDLTGKAVAAQRTQLAAYQQADEERIRARYVAEGAMFSVGSGCRVGVPVEQCRLFGPHQQPLQQAFRAENLVALGNALDAYARSLALLAADTTADTQAFSTSLLGVAGSVGALQGAVTRASARAIPQSTLNGVASIVATATGLYFEAQRVAALRRIIVESNPLVQQAAMLLGETDETLQSISYRQRLDALQAARRRHEAAVLAKMAPAVIRARQDDLFLAYQRLQQEGSASEGFSELARAHDKLATIASSRASAADLLEAIEHLAQAAKSISRAASTIRG